MQKILFVVLVVSLVGCGESRNDVMTKLINEKKTLEDSLSIAQYLEQDFMSKSKDSARATHDTLIYLPLVDSSSKYFGVAHNLKERITATEFSIDSLTKMK